MPRSGRHFPPKDLTISRAIVESSYMSSDYQSMVDYRSTFDNRTRLLFIDGDSYDSDAEKVGDESAGFRGPRPVFRTLLMFKGRLNSGWQNDYNSAFRLSVLSIVQSCLAHRVDHTFENTERRNRTKPFVLSCCLLMLVFMYAFVGGLVFNYLERDALQSHKDNDRRMKMDCMLESLHEESVKTLQQRAHQVVDCFMPPRDVRSEWSFVTATLYGFGLVTTLGYNRIAPITRAGRLFCIVYGISGIPLTMIIVANLGQYLHQFAGDSRRKIEEYRERRRRSIATLNGREIEDSEPIQINSPALLMIFLLYVAVGATILPALNGEIDFLNGLYYNFLCLTAIDFGQLVPAKVVFLPITFLYVLIGLAITTIAIEIGSEYLKKLHNLGKKVKNAAKTRIWFGGKKLAVRDLLRAVGRKCGVDAAVIDALDLENVVERTIAINEGREPTPDTNTKQNMNSIFSRRPPLLPSSTAESATPTEDTPFMMSSPDY